MSTHRDEHGYLVSKNARGFIGGLVMGGLIGSGAMLLLAPQSGKEARAKIQREGLDLRNQMVEGVGDAVTLGRGQVRRMGARVRKQADALEQRGQDMLDGQVKVVDDVVDAEKTAVHNIARNAKRLKRRGKHMVEEQRDAVSEVVEAERRAVHDLAAG
jgi:gas vesicle protein